MLRCGNEFTNVLRPLVKLARKANTAADVRAAEAMLCGCQVFVRTSIEGEVNVSPALNAVPLAISNPWQG